MIKFYDILVKMKNFEYIIMSSSRIYDEYILRLLSRKYLFKIADQFPHTHTAEVSKIYHLKDISIYLHIIHNISMMIFFKISVKKEKKMFLFTVE